MAGKLIRKNAGSKVEQDKERSENKKLIRGAKTIQKGKKSPRRMTRAFSGLGEIIQEEIHSSRAQEKRTKRRAKKFATDHHRGDKNIKLRKKRPEDDKAMKKAALSSNRKKKK